MDGSEGGWETVAPSPLSYGHNLPKMPRELTIEEILRIQQDFAAAAARALDAGFEWLELHFAHGFLAQTFFSPLTNQRQDRYGGDFVGRTRFIMETLKAVQEVWPERLPLTVRFGCREFDSSESEAEVIRLVAEFKERDVDLLDVSMGFTNHNEAIPWGSGMLAKPSDMLKKETGIPTAVSWSRKSSACEFNS